MDPDLASVLNTLSALSGVQSTPTPAPAPPPAQSSPTPTPAQAQARTATGPIGPGIGEKDPRKITSWPPALRYITAKAQQPAFQARLKQLLASQRAHERKWWQGREAVVQRLNEREGRRGEVEGVLRAVGAPIIDYKISDDDLTVYDRKIYAASVSMAEALERELAALGVPFFNVPGDFGSLKKRMLEFLLDLVDENEQEENHR